jgi:putative Holliday junction resolvase
MGIATIDALTALEGGRRRLAGLDPGTKTIGVAISDVGRRLATPHSVIRRTRFAADTAALLAIFAELDVAGIVLGLPLNMDGTEGPRAQASRAFARNLAALTPLPIVPFDERLTTAEAERAMIAANRSRAQRAATIDAAAAAIILQTALDRLAYIRTETEA